MFREEVVILNLRPTVILNVSLFAGTGCGKKIAGAIYDFLSPDDGLSLSWETYYLGMIYADTSIWPYNENSLELPKPSYEHAALRG